MTSLTSCVQGDKGHVILYKALPHILFAHSVSGLVAKTYFQGHSNCCLCGLLRKAESLTVPKLWVPMPAGNLFINYQNRG